MADRQTLLSEHGEGAGVVGPKFSRSRIRDDLLPQDRRRLRNILPYVRSCLNGYRGALISGLDRTGHPSAADELRGLTLEDFMERAAEIRTGMRGRPYEVWRWWSRITLLRNRRERLEELIDMSLIRGRELSDRGLLELADELFSEEAEFSEQLAEDLREVVGTETAMRRARQVDSLKARAEEKEEEIGNMYPPVKRLRRCKIRIYNEEFKPVGEEEETPRGILQCWYEIDVLADAGGRVDWSWDLTRKEIAICKQAFVAYWSLKGEKDGKEFDYSDAVQTSLGKYPSRPEETPEGVAIRNADATRGGEVKSKYWGSGSSRFSFPKEEPAVNKKQFADKISERMNKPVRELTVEDIAVGESAKPLETVPEPTGVVQNMAAKLDPDTYQIEWQDTREYRIHWDTEEEDLKSAKQELEREGII